MDNKHSRLRATLQGRTAMSRRLALLLPTAVLLTGLATTALGTWWLHSRTQNEAAAEFQRIVVRHTSEISDRFGKPVYGLNGARGVYATQAEVRRDDFRRYLSTRNLPVEFPGVRGFGFIQRVERAEMPAFIAAERADGAPNFALRQLASKDEPEHFVIKLIEPAANNAGAAGLDVGSEKVRRQGVLQALETGEATTTGMVTLVQDQRRSAGVLLYVPVFADAPKDAAPGARGALRGLLYAPMVISELLAGLGDVVAGQAHVTLFDTASATVEGPVMFESAEPAAPGASDAALPAARFEVLRTVDVPGRLLTLRVRSTPAFEAAYASTTAMLMALGGLFASGLLAALLRQQITGRGRAERLAREMTVDLANQKFALDQHAIVSMSDLQGTIFYVNQRFCDISGYSEAELIGQNHRIVSSGVHEPAFFEDLWRTICSGQVWHGQICNRHKGGGHYWVDATVVPLLGADGLAESYIAIRTDISGRKAAERGLARERKSLQHIIEGTQVGTWEWNVETGQTVFNERWAQIVGHSLADLGATTIDTWARFGHPDDL
ncbi:MAG: CHASE domain-containing protein, partial [Rubrivivax sp.]|nr:CHASE domain-containing protein [Rubrivivax sp.]